MNDIAISTTDLSKQYHIGGLKKSNDRLGEQLVDLFVAPFRRTRKLLRGQSTGAAELDKVFWALKNVNFEIKQGEVVGIIGRNGAGKSTLLRILSRITEPTTGHAEIIGRVGSLLEVGTGFHPELTGRENVYLNGAILGMRKIEIERKFDEIVNFSGIEKFIDTPVKHYSSGMYVRLAFSVAAHLEPEILLVDEVLAVGDVAFQQKCLGKMDDVAQKGRTVMFVSHNMSLMQSLCQRGIFLNDGHVHTDSSITEAVDAYLRTLEIAETQDLLERKDRQGHGEVRLIGVEVNNGIDASSSILKTGDFTRFIFQVNGMIPGMGCSFSIFDQLGQPVTNFTSQMRGPEDSYNSQNYLKFICEIDELLLLPGRYRIDVWISGDNRLQDALRAACFFNVGEGHIGGRPVQPKKRFRVSLPHRWELPFRD